MSEVPPDAQTPFTYQAATPYYSPPKRSDHDDHRMEDKPPGEDVVDTRAGSPKEDTIAKALDFGDDKPQEPGADRLVGPFVIARPTKRPGAELSEGAIYKRMRRVFTPRADGTYLVDEEFVRKWKDLDTRDELNILFEKCDYNPDTRLFFSPSFWSEC